MEYWLKDIIPSQILLKVCSVQFKWCDCGQQWCIGKECKNRAIILPPLLCTLLAKPTSLLRLPGQSQPFGHGSCSCWWVGLLSAVCEFYWPWLQFWQQLQGFCAETYGSCVVPSGAPDWHRVPAFQMVADTLHHFYSLPCKHLYFTGHSCVQPSWRIVICWVLLVWTLLPTCGWSLVPFPGSFCSFCMISELGWFWLHALVTRRVYHTFLPLIMVDLFFVPFLLVAKSCIFWLPLSWDVIMF